MVKPAYGGQPCHYFGLAGLPVETKISPAGQDLFHYLDGGSYIYFPRQYVPAKAAVPLSLIITVEFQVAVKKEHILKGPVFCGGLGKVE